MTPSVDRIVAADPPRSLRERAEAALAAYQREERLSQEQEHARDFAMLADLTRSVFRLSHDHDVVDLGIQTGLPAIKVDDLVFTISKRYLEHTGALLTMRLLGSCRGCGWGAWSSEVVSWLAAEDMPEVNQAEAGLGRVLVDFRADPFLHRCRIQQSLAPREKLLDGLEALIRSLVRDEQDGQR